MRSHLRFILAGILAVAVGGGTARAQSVTFTPVKAVYADAKELSLKKPEGVACAESGAVVVADTGNARLVSYTLRDGVISGGTEVKPTQLAYPTAVQLDSKGNILALDRKLKRIVRLDPKGAFVGVLEIRNAMPAAFKLDRADNIYVLDAASGKVLVADAVGAVTRTIGGPKDGPLFMDFTIDNAGTVYAVDAVGATIWSAAKDAKEFTALTKSMKDRMNFPTYITTDNRGKLFVVDQNGNGIVVLGQDGSFQGRQLSTGWAEGALYYPTQLCVLANGDVLVADRQNNRVQLFTLAR